MAAMLFAAAPAGAHVRAFVGWPVYPVPFGYYAQYPYAYPSPTYVYGADPVPPAGWVAGHWEWRRGPWGRPVRVWVPPYLQ
ncbi:MAG: hypothetical protein ACREQL_11980 [Candidatus Binatia bacterium]